MFKLPSRDPALEDTAIKKLTITSGLLYGVFYAVGFSLVTWGSDGLLLNKFGDAAPWDKLLVGLPILLLIGILAGGIGVLTSSNLISILVWGAVGYGTGFLVGHVPFDGINLITWLREPRLWGEVIYAFEKGAQVRTVLITVITTLLGFFVGGLKNMAVHWAWDQGTQNHRLSWKSVLVLWISLPPVILQAVMADQFMNRPLREPQKAIAALVEIALEDEAIITDSQKVGLRSLQPYQQEITPIYQSHLVGFSKSTDSWYSGYVDLGLSPSLILRCVTVGDRVVYCDDYSKRLDGWVGDLVYAGLTGEQRWLDDPIKRISVDETVISWLASVSAQLNDAFAMQVEQILRGWYLVNVRFSTGFEMQCRFHGVEPVVVDECVIASSTVVERLPGAPEN